MGKSRSSSLVQLISVHSKILNVYIRMNVKDLSLGHNPSETVLGNENSRLTAPNAILIDYNSVC